ncbi:AEC family transporter [Cryptosporangium phraense]|uniref:AEC family transporter n=1 Tax=Cryptosporangium phraense TaxID=2593070 RepID=A0A545ANP4_9ACTN|nr:AEC family transporter [Cryptosporangium phraense]TQS42948.1 AEC family transporter [Cryptosporangium phraense]
MSGALSGFAAIGVLIAVGYVLGWRGTLGSSAQPVLARLAVSVATPCLLFTTVTHADPSLLTAPTAVVPLVTCLAAMAVFVVVAVVRRWRGEVRVMGTIASGFPNLGNLGIPVASYVLGNAALVAPLILVQLAVQSPVALSVLELRGANRVRSIVTNPVLVATVLALVVAATGVPVPFVVAEPVRILGGVAVPAVLLAFGMSLVGSSWPGRDGDRGPLALIVGVSLARPVLAWLLTLGQPESTVYAAVVLAALPAAQNVAVWAAHYGVAARLARETVLITTFLAPVVILVATALLR